MLHSATSWPAMLRGPEEASPAEMLRARNIAAVRRLAAPGTSVAEAKKLLARAPLVNVAVNTDSSCCAAMGNRLFEALDAEWATVGTSPQARAAFGRWALVEPA